MIQFVGLHVYLGQQFVEIPQLISSLKVFDLVGDKSLFFLSLSFSWFPLAVFFIILIYF